MRDSFEPNEKVIERNEGRAANSAAGESGANCNYAASLHAIVGRFARDDDVVHMAFAQAGGGDAHKAGLFG